MLKKNKDKEYWRDDPTFMDSEKFFNIPGYEGKYQVSNFGNVKSFCNFVDGVFLKPGLSSNGYLSVSLSKDNKGRTKNVHKIQQLVFFNNTKGWMDHKDNIRTNNMLTNLRIASCCENGRNVSKQKNATSKYIGVYYYKNRDNWHSSIRLGKKKKHLGYFKNEKDAAIAYDNAVKKYRSETMEFNKLNFN